MNGTTAEKVAAHFPLETDGLFYHFKIRIRTSVLS